MVKTIGIVVLSVLLVGCTRTITRTETVEVEIPVPVECEQPPLVERPLLPIHSLTENSGDDVTARAYVETIKLLQKHSDTLEKYLNAYR